jgi:hypothetical protein
MLNIFAKVFLVATSFAPVLLTYAYVYYLKDGASAAAISLVVVTILLVLVCVLLIKAAKSTIGTVSFPISSVKTADTETVGFVVAYLLPLIAPDSATVNLNVLMFVLVIFFLVVLTTNSYHCNPLMGLLGYHFYEVTTAQEVTFLLITRRDVRNSRSVERVIQLTDYMVLDPGERSAR